MDDRTQGNVRHLMTPKQLAELLGVEVNTLAKWRLTGRGPAHVKFGTNVRYDERDVSRFIDDSRRRSTSEQMAPSAA